MNKKISFPHLGNYYIPISHIIKNITKCEIIIPEYNNKKTIEEGSRYSPTEICMPFKYNLGNYLDALNKGANILIQAGGGCRYGYYAELQEQILKDLGYQFEFINLIEANHISLKKMYKISKKLNPKLNVFKYIYHLLEGMLIIIIMDKLETYLRANIGYEKILLLYQPATYEVADVISTYAYRRGIVEANYSYSTAVGLFNSVVNLIFLVLSNKLSKKLGQSGLF